MQPYIDEITTAGDGLHDHYGERTPFTMLKAEQNNILIAEKLSDHVKTWSCINATGGYGAGFWTGSYASLSETISQALLECPSATDEYHSLDRLNLISLIKSLLAHHTDTTPQEWEMTFTSTGTEAMDFVLQQILLEGYSLASGVHAHQDKDVLITCRGAWHGWSVASLQLLDRRQFTDGIPKLPNVTNSYIRYGDIDSLKKAFATYSGRIRAVFVEGLLGDGGVIKASDAWWQELRNLCTKENARLIDDEILTGLRTGAFLACPQGIKPDVITLGKALGLGLFPVSLVAWRDKSLSPRPGVGVRTFNARPLQARIINQALKSFLAEHQFEQCAAKGLMLLNALKEVVAKYPQVYREVRGQGLLLGVELAKPYAKKGRFIRDTLLRLGVLTEVESGQLGTHIPREERVHETLRMTPPFSITEQECLAIAEIFEKAGQKILAGENHALYS